MVKRKEGIIGLILLITSGCIFTFERFLSVLVWLGDAVPVKINGSGTYMTKPVFPGIFDNMFVPLFFILGLVLILISIKIREKE
jgi:hypothetical protein